MGNILLTPVAKVATYKDLKQSQKAGIFYLTEKGDFLKKTGGKIS